MATEAAAGKDVNIGGGPSVVRQYLQAGLIDQLHLVLSPILLGRGEQLFADTPPAIAHQFTCTEMINTGEVTHFFLERISPSVDKFDELDEFNS
jgi:dihydrofolate reductase